MDSYNICPICGKDLTKHQEEYWSGEYNNILNIEEWYACDHCQVTFTVNEIEFPDGEFE